MVDLQYISFSTKQSSTQSLFFGPKQCSAGQVNSLYFTNNKSPPPTHGAPPRCQAQQKAVYMLL